jgi:hypothetical protein
VRIASDGVPHRLAGEQVVEAGHPRLLVLGYMSAGSVSTLTT